jgi:hypothetical protein
LYKEEEIKDDSKVGDPMLMKVIDDQKIEISSLKAEVEG